jgi:hypothetical protein
MTSCSLAGGCHSFGGTCCLYLQTNSEEHIGRRFPVPENVLLRRALWHSTEETRGIYITLHHMLIVWWNQEGWDFRHTWDGERDAYKFTTRKREGKTPIGRHRHRWKDIKYSVRSTQARTVAGSCKHVNRILVRKRWRNSSLAEQLLAPEGSLCSVELVMTYMHDYFSDWKF